MICCPIANVVISIGTPKKTLMNLWQTTNVKHFANTHYYNLKLTLKIMTEKKEMLLIEKTQWEAIVSKVRDLTLKVSMLKDKCVTQPQYYNNKELCKVLGVEERLIQKYREQGLLAYSKIGDKYWYSQQDVLDFLEKTRHPAF